MAGYTKLFQSIVASTIWRACNPTRLVWITMLAMVDRHGTVEASIPGLADLARVTLPECQQALEELAAPDAWSRSKVLEGRRITEVDGGWHLVNFDKFRHKMSAEDRRDYLRVKQQESRDRKRQQSVNNPLTNKQNQHIAAPAPDATTEEEQDLGQRTRVARSKVADFDRFWAVYPKRKAKGDARKAWQTLKPSLLLVATILEAIDTQSRWPEWTKDHGQFIPLPATWLRAQRWDDQPTDVHDPRTTRTRCPHDPPCTRAPVCTRKSLNDARRQAGQPLLEDVR